ncbi:hypothetical protein MASR2M15_03980 [Anaerolineales bacterium]
MTDRNPIDIAEEKAQALLEDATSGAIIPMRLPDQVKEIVQQIQASRNYTQTSTGATSHQVINNEEDSKFVGHAVHELRTPITSIRGYADMMKSMGELNDMQLQFLDVIISNSKRMQSLLMDFSYMNKIRHGTLNVSSKMDMFKNIALKCEKEMSGLAEELGKELVFTIPQGLPLLNTDGDHLTFALNKLIENSLRYSGEDGKVEIIGESEENTLIIKIIDNGVGMTEEELKKVGTPYFRSDRDEIIAYKGSGLGLSVAMGIMELLNGNIKFESTVNEGTKVEIHLEGMA